MITKKYLKTKPVAKVTFSLSKTQHHGAKKVTIAGDFNNWNTTETPLKQNKDGKFSVSIDLEKGKSYQFRYVLDGKTWENDWKADAYVPNNITFDENSVVEV